MYELSPLDELIINYMVKEKVWHIHDMLADPRFKPSDRHAVKTLMIELSTKVRLSVERNGCKRPHYWYCPYMKEMSHSNLRKILKAKYH